MKEQVQAFRHSLKASQFAYNKKCQKYVIEKQDSEEKTTTEIVLSLKYGLTSKSHLKKELQQMKNCKQKKNFVREKPEEK